MENQTYQCSWKQTKRGFCLWLKKHPRLKITEKTFEQAEDELHGQVCGEFGDGESVFEFDPPPPVKRKARSYFDPDLFVFDSNDSVRVTGQEAGLYSEGFCACCGGGQGKRTSKPRTLPSVPRCDIGFVLTKPQVKLFSKKAVGVLCRAGLRKTAFQEVHFSVKSKAKFFELVGEPEVEFVGVKAPPRKTDGWECAKCGLKWIHPFHTSVPPAVFDFLARQDVKKVSRDVFVTGSRYQRNICLSGIVAKKLRRLSGLRGILTSRVALLDEDEVDRKPKVKIVKKGGFC